MTGIKAAAARFGFALGRHRLPPARHHHRHQCRAGAQARPGRAGDDGAASRTCWRSAATIAREIYALNPQVPPALIPRDRRIGIAERIRADGSVESAARARTALEASPSSSIALEAETVAVCLLNAYVNPAHERICGTASCARPPGLTVSCSARGQPRDPRVRAQLDHGAQRAADPDHRRLSRQARAPHAEREHSSRACCWCSRTAACAAPRRRRSSRCACCCPAPAAAAPRAPLLGQALGDANIVGIDMGGTSFDVSVVRDGRVNLVTQGEIDGCPCACRWWRSAPSAPAAARSPRSRRRTPDRRAARAPARGRARPATAAAAPSRRSRTPTSRSAGSMARASSAAACGSTPRAARAAIDDACRRARSGSTLEAARRGPARRHQRQPRRRHPPQRCSRRASIRATSS